MEPVTSGTLPSTAAGQLGYGIASFLIPMAFGYILLRFAGSSMRKPSTALALRICAVVLVLLLVYAGALGGGAFDPGGIAAAIVTVSWALWQQFRKSAASA